MPLKARAGFVLVELLMGLVLLGVVSTAICTLLVNHQRLYRSQMERVDLNGALRAAALILPSELRELDASDGDILAMTPTSITYKAMRGGGVLCLTPNPGAMTLTLDKTASFGLRAIALSDSLLVLADVAPVLKDRRWLHGSVSAVTMGTACAEGAHDLNSPSTTLALAPNFGANGVTAAALAGVGIGAPVRFFEVSKVTLYEDGSSEYWLGLQTYASSSASWAPTQPLAGPLTSSGLSFTYYTMAGSTTSAVTCVARIGIVIRGRTAEAIRVNTGALARATDSLVTSVALRNNNRNAASC